MICKSVHEFNFSYNNYSGIFLIITSSIFSTDYTFLQIGNPLKWKQKSDILHIVIASTLICILLNFRLGVLSLNTAYLVETEDEVPIYYAKKKIKLK